MSEEDDASFERALASCLRSRDAVARRDALLADPSLSPRVREWLAAMDADGLRLTRLIVARLRYERLLAGSDVVATWAERDPDTFVDAFARYHEAVPPVSVDPAEEASAFAQFHAGSARPH